MRWNFKIWVSDVRAATIYQDIFAGSLPAPRFYLMVAASSMIATLGLMLNSAAVVIGAMLVAPLMTPIFGISLALVRGDTPLLVRATQAETSGMVMAVLLAVCVGYLMPSMEITAEMLSRTRPSLLDLLVAVFAGFSGAYAMVDEKISPVLPGVAIATAIMPPLVNTGLCIALGAFDGAVGSFLLFFANFLSILMVASMVFFSAGMGRELKSLSSKAIIKRFSLATIGFIIVTVLLSKALFDIVSERRLRDNINAALTEELAHMPVLELHNIVFKKKPDKLYCLAHIHSSAYITPSRVKFLEKAMERKLGEPVELFVRSTLSKDVSATGSIHQLVTETLDQFSVDSQGDARVDILKSAEQTIREYLQALPSRYVAEVNLLPKGSEQVVLATMYGPKALSDRQIQELEQQIQHRAANEHLSLVIRHIELNLHDRHGRFYYEWITMENIQPDQQQVIDDVTNFIESEFKGSEYEVVNIDFTVRQGKFLCLIELTGRKLYSLNELETLRGKIPSITKEPVNIYVRSRPEVVLSEKGYGSFESLQKQLLDEAETLYEQHLRQLTEGAL